MNKIIISFIGLALFTIAMPAMASEVTGTLTTGISTGLSGIVDGAPVASPVPGTYTSTQNVTLTATNSDSIHYTITSTDPTCTTGTTYTGAIAVSSSQTIRAVACFGTSNPVSSAVKIFAYGISVSTPSGGGGGGGGGYIQPATTLIGDINHDGVVNILDFNALLVQWGKTGSSLSADLNHDGVVGILDFNMLIIHWHQTK